ncbi:MAG: ABC transporter ATP-binding protein [Parasporobacterium sp.]|nr:ABC transporter ATP-binding protein [Parasporobacterium sp.]
MKNYSIKKSLLRLKKVEKNRIEAVKGVSFSLEKGKILGIVGKNGSGKSTMLKSIAGIFAPDSGTVDLHGNTISLMSIGVGFSNELTGRENIALSGMLLGFSAEQIKDKTEEIIRFSELGKFIDMPVRTYSSGMHSKLAFSITAILETDIMLIDEVLSVGDAKFKKKSLNKMKELISDTNRTVVIVSHSMDTLKKLCDTILWINDGEMMMYGSIEDVLPKYEEFMS